jgi:hypothetical protein
MVLVIRSGGGPAIRRGRRSHWRGIERPARLPLPGLRRRPASQRQAVVCGRSCVGLFLCGTSAPRAFVGHAVRPVARKERHHVGRHWPLQFAYTVRQHLSPLITARPPICHVAAVSGHNAGAVPVRPTLRQRLFDCVCHADIVSTRIPAVQPFSFSRFSRSFPHPHAGRSFARRS